MVLLFTIVQFSSDDETIVAIHVSILPQPHPRSLSHRHLLYLIPKTYCCRAATTNKKPSRSYLSMAFNCEAYLSISS